MRVLRRIALVVLLLCVGITRPRVEGCLRCPERDRHRGDRTAQDQASGHTGEIRCCAVERQSGSLAKAAQRTIAWIVQPPPLGSQQPGVLRAKANRLSIRQPHQISAANSGRRFLPVFLSFQVHDGHLAGLDCHWNPDRAERVRLRYDM
jgi:hypothetical protein